MAASLPRYRGARPALTPAEVDGSHEEWAYLDDEVREASRSRKVCLNWHLFSNPQAALGWGRRGSIGRPAAATGARSPPAGMAGSPPPSGAPALERRRPERLPSRGRPSPGGESRPCISGRGAGQGRSRHSPPELRA